MIRALAPAVGDIVVTAFADARATAADALAIQVRAALAGAGGRVERVHVAATTAAALETAWRLSRDIVVAGSIFLLGEAYPLLGRPDPFQPDWRGARELSRMAVLSCGVVSAGPRSLVRALVALLFIIAAAPGAGAQAPTAAPAAADVRLGSAARQERLGLHHIRYSGAVEIELVSQGIRFSADVADYFDDEHRLIAVGNVVFVTPSSRISADKADFDTRSRTGTFFNAFGSASVSDKVDKSYFGSQEPDAFFYGETIEKIGVDRYRIHKGAFTTCVQPTPRWEVAADTVTLTIDKRAVLKNAVLKVKDVPLFYIPAMYYPINKEDRSTGFLLPVYGTSTIRGTSFSNAFFWAINRSQDLTADARLVHQDRPGLRRRVPLRRVGGLERRVPHVSPERARQHVPAERPGRSPSRRARASRSAPTWCRRSPAGSRPAAASTTSAT